VDYPLFASVELLQSLEQILRSNIENIEEADLRLIVALKHVREVVYEEDYYSDEGIRISYRAIDSLRVRQLAEQELSRRGLKT